MDRIVLMATALAVGLGTSLAHAQDIRATIEAGNAKWDAAFNKKDAAGIAALYAADAKLLPPAKVVVSGPAEIEKFFKSILEGGFADHKIEIVDLKVEGNLAYQAGRWTATGPAQGGTRATYTGSLISVLEKQADGSWKSRAHTWNVAN
ncbi:YybH family protein [Prosthecomicrobium sp. N25]|uniref:YybH family protein n=1 Tax=Prosthecomicrobium sp. N25 TaxID=3129254 RepID=UPI003077CE12